ncbi:MAG: alpha/beta hydrolase [Tissierella sp.]|uniref:alpha/beta hydrolase n=1 Tax=Tissierella sp. TaxID=41274 RepID=UPI003F9E071E
MEQYFIKIESTNVRISEWGNTNNPTIICIHGLGSTSLSFIELGEMLKDKYHIISIDLPGHGKTTPFKSDEEYEMLNLSRWLDKVIEKIEENNFYLLAHSWGADIALHYASKYVHKIKKLILLDGGYYIKKEIYEFFSDKLINGNLEYTSICSLQDEIDYYYKDFDEYVFNNLQDHIEVEKNNYMRWSPLLEKAAKDLVIKEDGKYKYHSKGITARGAIKGMYNSPPNLIYDKLPKDILLLQCTMDSREYWNDLRNVLCNNFKENTNATVKKIKRSSHMIHWDNPNDIFYEIVEWFK